MSLKTKKTGFTLIELLVVISIISLLSSVVLSSLNATRAKARDAIRKQTLRQLQNALEIYFNNNGSYPPTFIPPNLATFSSETSDGYANNSGNWIPGLVASGAISSLPKDPLGGVSTNATCSGGGWKRSFTYASDGKNYKLMSHCAPEGTWGSGDRFYDASRPTWAWAISSQPYTGSCVGGNYTYTNNETNPICW